MTEEVDHMQQLDELMMNRAGSRSPDDYPEKLYHYTSSDALLSILKSGELWFTDYRYLNDLSELKYGVDLYAAEVAARAEVESDTAIEAMLHAVRKQFEHALVYTDVFVFCMCEENNLLNQWRVYGRSTVPASIQFSTRGFMFVPWTPYSFELVPMVYDESAQQRIVKESIAVGIEYARTHKHTLLSSDEAGQSYVEMFTALCVDWCTSLKHPQFAVEKEWRLSTRWGLEHRILTGRSFRPSSSGIVPYLRMGPEKGNDLSEELPIHGITIGPCNQPEIQRRTLVELLYQFDKANIEVDVSQLPIRVV